jgi:altronate hydrolase
MKQKVLKVHPKDNVLVALTDLKKDDVIEYGGETFVLLEDIKAKHKFFMTDLQLGDKVIMYGVLVGTAQKNIAKASWMSTENIKHAAEPYFYRKTNFTWTAPDVSKFKGRTFNGYHRKDGRVGTANYWLFVPTVFCENRNLDVIKEALHNELGYAVTDKYKSYTKELIEAYKAGKELPSAESFAPSPGGKDGKGLLFKNVDGIKFLNHQGGCGGTRQDAGILGKLLASYANHPNVAGVTVLSLGCQNLQTDDFLKELKNFNPNFDKPLYIFEQQQSQSEEQLIAEAIKKTFEGLIEINKIERQPAPLTELCIGVKCGGSDGFSGISANPAVKYYWQSFQNCVEPNKI